VEASPGKIRHEIGSKIEETISRRRRQTAIMEPPTLMKVQVLDEDLQIVRATLATIADDVHHFSGEAGHAIVEALEKIDHAQEEVARLRTD
jgi:hypothetical protein